MVHPRARVKAALVLGAFAAPLLASSLARAVVEPNGVQVPLKLANGEITLWDYFAAQGEALDPVLDASDQPELFSPLCDFTATLVLKQTSATPSLEWYTPPTDPNAAPPASDVHLIVPLGSPVGQVVTGADIRNDPGYKGGLIGFRVNAGTDRIFYTEPMRNAYCSTCATPGYYRMALIYTSTTAKNTFYLAFEDWFPGDSAQAWMDNGDFNDFVFKVTGVTCNGGNQPCDTGKPGICGAGVTTCKGGGVLECQQVGQPSPEKCDDIDNNCDGQIDEGNLCPTGQVCYHGNCVAKCNTGEFQCPSTLECDTASGFCMDPKCVGVSCAAGTVCRGGTCVGPCDGVVCPTGQTCEVGRCVDPCKTVTCDTGYVCENGACVTPCSCRGCATGKTCATSGQCVDTGCETKTCDATTVCVGGNCVDPCAGAVCPGGAACTNGACGEPVAGGAGGTGSVLPDGGLIGFGGAPSNGGTSSGNAGATAAGGDTVSGRTSSDKPSCACRTDASGAHDSTGLALAGLALGWAVRRRRQKSANRS